MGCIFADDAQLAEIGRPTSIRGFRYGAIMTNRDWLFLGGGVVAGVAIAIAFPKARRHLAPIISETGERAGSIISGLAEMVATQMEKVEDYAAERNAPPPADPA